MSTAETLAAARKTLAAHDDASRAHAAHGASVKAHTAGEPVKPRTERPTAPTSARPTPAEELAAAGRIADAVRASGKREGAAQAVTEAEAAHTTAVATAATAAEEARRIGRLPDIVRAAPGRLLKRQIDALPEMAHVRFVVDGDSLRIDGMSTRGVWVDARSLSDGEAVRASAELRCAIKEAAHCRFGVWGAVRLPIDNRQDWSGDLDGVTVNRIEMVTLTPNDS